MSDKIDNKDKKFYYVYLITEISTGLKYIGSRGTAKPNLILDLMHYRSSSKNNEFRKKQVDNQSDFKYEILSTHDSRYDAIIEESRLHELYNVSNNDDYYNISNQTTTGFSTYGKVCVKDENNNNILVSKTDPRYISGEFKFHHNNKVPVKDMNGNNFLVCRNDPRYLSGELVSVLTGKVTVKDMIGNTFQTSTDDPRYISGELVGATKGRPTSEKTKELMRNKLGNGKSPLIGKKASQSTKEKLSNHYLIDEVEYIGRKSVAKYYGVHEGTVDNRCKSPKFDNWQLIKTKYKNK